MITEREREKISILVMSRKETFNKIAQVLSIEHL